MPFTKIWIHAVWAVKNREPILKQSFRQEFFSQIKEYAQEKNIYLDHINGYVEHVHCLLGLRPKQNLSDVLQIIKGDSSHWFDQQHFSKQKLTWQSDYYAATVSPTHLDAVRAYIRKQEEHHRHVSFQEELDRFIRINELT